MHCQLGVELDSVNRNEEIAAASLFVHPEVEHCLPYQVPGLTSPLNVPSASQLNSISQCLDAFCWLTSQLSTTNTPLHHRRLAPPFLDLSRFFLIKSFNNAARQVCYVHTSRGIMRPMQPSASSAAASSRILASTAANRVGRSDSGGLGARCIFGRAAATALTVAELATGRDGLRLCGCLCC